MLVSEFLEHHGVKGMHWGVRRDRSSGAETSGTPDHSKRNKALKIAGGVAAVALVAAGTAYLVKHPELLSKAANSLSDDKNVEKGKKFVDDFSSSKEPTSPIHAARTKNNGYDFPMRGGLSSPVLEYDKAGFQKNPRLAVGGHIRYGSKNEKVAVAFNDPHGRKDRAGRTILHEVIIPHPHSEGINTFEEAKSKAWSMVKDTYNPLYDLPDRDMVRYEESLRR